MAKPKYRQNTVASRVERHEVATVGTERDHLTYAFNGILSPQDATLISRGGGRGLAIYDEIERDCHASAVLNKRKLAVISRPLMVHPASDSPLDKKAADIVREQLEAMSFDQACLKLLDATLKGFAIGEVMWRVDGGTIVAERILARDQRRFLFDQDSQPRLITRTNVHPGEALPERKFIVHRYGAKDENPYGLGLGTRLFWPVFFKRQGIKYWMVFCEKFGMPTAVGKYAPGTEQQERRELLNALSQIAQDAGIIVPKDSDISFLEAQRSGSINTYESLARYMDEEMSKAVLGETLTTTMGKNGARAASETHDGIRLELVQADNDLLSDTLTDTLSRWITELNVPGAKPPRITRDCTQSEDLKTRADRDKIIYDMGYKPTPAYIQKHYGEGFVPRIAAVPGKPLSADASFAEVMATYPDQATLDDAANSPPEKLSAALESLLKPVVEGLQATTNPEQALLQLAEAFPALDDQALTELLARCLFVADTWGRLNA